MPSVLPAVTLQRISTSDEGTYGKLSFLDKVLYTGECPWRNDRPDYSCVTAGQYPVIIQPSAFFAERYPKGLYHLQNLPDGRTLVMIHPANWMGDSLKGYHCDLEGCIALGLSVGPVDPYPNQQGIRGSTAALAQFMEAMNYQPFMLNIVDIPSLAEAA